MHQPIIVGHHDAVYPAQFGGTLQTAFHIAVGAESKQPDLAGGLGFFSPGSGIRVHFADAADSVNKEKIHIIGLHALKGFIQLTGHAFDAPGTGFGHQKDFLTILWVFGEILADAYFASAAAVTMGGIPVCYAPIDGLFEHQMIGFDIKHSPQRQNRDFLTGLAKRAGGNGAIGFCSV